MTHRRSDRLTVILLTLGITAAVSLCPVFLPAAPPPAKSATQPSEQSPPPPPIATTKGMAEEAFRKKAQAGNRRAIALYRQKKYAEAVAQFVAAAQDYDAAKWPISAAYMYGWKGDCHRNAKDYRAAVKSYSECVRRCVELKQKGIKGLALNAGNLAKALKQLKRYEDAATAYGQSAEAYRQLKQPPKAAKAQFNRAVALYRGKKYRSAAAGFDRAVVAYQKAKDTLNVAWTYGWKGKALRDAKDDRAAVKAYTECVRRFGGLKEEGLKGLSLNASRLGKALKRLRRYADAAKTFQQAADAYERRKRAADAAWMYGWKGDAHRDGKESQAAVKAYSESVRRFARLKEKGFSGLALNAGNLAREFRGLKQYDLAATAYGQSAEAYRQLKRSSDAAEALFYQADVLLRLKQYQRAAAAFGAAAQAYNLAGEPLDVALMYGWQGDSLRNGKDDRGAVKAYIKSVRRYVVLKDKGLKGLSINASNLGKALNRLRQYTDAAKAFQQAADAYDRRKRATNAAWMYSWKASCYRDTKDDPAAVKAYAESVRRFAGLKAQEGLEGLSVNARDLGKALRRLRRYADAVKAFQQAADAYKRRKDPLNSAWMHGWKGDCQRDAKDYQAAVKSYSECTRRFALLGKPGLQGLVLNAGNLGQALRRLKRYDEAATALDRVVAARAMQYGQDDYRTIDARLNVAELRGWAKLTDAQQQQLAEADRRNGEVLRFIQEGKHAHGVTIARGVLGVRQDVLGPQHRHVAASLNILALLYYSMDDYAKAEPPLQRASEIWKKAVGKHHPDYATSLNNLGELYREMGAYAKAEPLYRRALKIHREAGGENHPDYALSLGNLGKLYEAMGAYTKAEPLLRQALAIRKKTSGEHHRDYAKSLYSLAALYKSMGAYTKAEPLYQQAREILKNTIGEHHPEYATSLDSLAGLYDDMGAYAKAEPLYRQALEIRKQVLGEQHPAYAGSLNNLAYLYQATGDYAQAKLLYLQALAIKKRVLGERHLDYASGLNNLAALYHRMGDYAKAEPLYRQAHKIRKKSLGENHPLYALGLNNLGGLYDDMGAYAKAEPLYRRSAEITKKVFGENHPRYASSLNNLATLYESMGDYAKSELLLQQALAIRKKVLGEEHPDYATSLNNLAALYVAIGDYAKAKPLYQHALKILKKAVGENHPDYAVSLNNLASLYKLMEDDAKAEPLYRQALKIRKKALGENHPSYAVSLNNLAVLYESMGDYAKAEPLYRQALEIDRRSLGENHPRYAADLNNLAGLYREMGNYAKAEPLYRQALAISRGFLERTSQAQSERQQLAMGQMLRYRLDSYISLALRKGDIPRQAFREILLWKGATLVRQRQYRQVANEPAVAELFKKLQRVTMQLSSLARAFPSKKQQVTGWKARIAALTAEKEKLEAELSRKSAAFRKAKQEITVRDVAVALPKNAVLVDFLEYSRSTPPNKPGGKTVYRQSLLASVLHPGGQVSLIDLGPTEPVSKAIETWRKTFGLSRQGVMAGRFLRKRLWDPLLPSIGNAKTVLVSPDGILGRLPLGALPGKKPGTYLLEEFRLALIPVPQLLPALVNEQGRKALRKNLLLMGGVDYNAALSGNTSASRSVTQIREGVTFGPLPGTLREVTGLDVLFREVFPAGAGDVTTLKQGAATEARFRKLAPQYYHLHLATHGFFAPSNRMSALSAALIGQATRSLRGGVYQRRATAVQGFSPGLLSGLAFAGANRPPQPDSDDGILTAEEIAFLPLDRVQLVTLSACETGLGASAGGEGLLGVQRAFQVSGARSTVASYWKVDDRVTQLMMQRFYRNLWEKKMPRLDALREAQLWLLHHPKLLTHPNQVRGLKIIDPQHDPRRSAAYYWAAFVLSGDWR